MFRTDVSLRAFARDFYLDNVEVRSNREQRWWVFLRAARNGVLLERPSVTGLWKPHVTYHEPMFDVLQSSYVDVEHELNVMRAASVARGDVFLFVAGDGLALMRLNHLLASKPDIYFDQTPFIIPVQGELAMCEPGARSFCDRARSFCDRARSFLFSVCARARIEMLNAAIKAHVSHFVSESQVKHFVANWALLECVQEHMRTLAYGPSAQRVRAHQVDAGPDVATLVEKFRLAVIARPQKTRIIDMGTY